MKPSRSAKPVYEMVNTVIIAAGILIRPNQHLLLLSKSNYRFDTIDGVRLELSEVIIFHFFNLFQHPSSF